MCVCLELAGRERESDATTPGELYFGQGRDAGKTGRNGGKKVKQSSSSAADSVAAD